MKIDRQKIFDKYYGHCSYCGCELKLDKFQVDHIFSKWNFDWYKVNYKLNFEADDLENLNPACAKCNNYKSSYTIGEYRTNLGLQVSRLLKTAMFNRALTFGQIEITESPIVFYFEKGKYQDN